MLDGKFILKKVDNLMLDVLRAQEGISLSPLEEKKLEEKLIILLSTTFNGRIMVEEKNKVQ